jgi:hypothetical protein
MTALASALAWLALLPASGPQAEICYSDARAATLVVPPTAATPFNCPQAGRATLTELAAQGFRVVKLSPLIVGQAGPTLQAADQLIVEIPIEVFVDGFEAS